MKRKVLALELSIKATVLIIILIIVLLGLGFLRTTFCCSGGYGPPVEGVKKEMMDEIERSDEIVMLSPQNIIMKPNEVRNVYLTIKNKLNDSAKVEYGICTKDMEADGTCSAGSESLVCMSIDPTSDCRDITIKTTPTTKIKPHEIGVYVVKISVSPSAKANIYLIPVVVKDPDGIEMVRDLTIEVK